MLEVAEISLQGVSATASIPRICSSSSITSNPARSSKIGRRAISSGPRTCSSSVSGHRSRSGAIELSLQQAKIALEEAQGMLERLTKFTGPKLIKSLEAKVQAIKSDMLTQEASFSLEEPATGADPEEHRELHDPGPGRRHRRLRQSDRLAGACRPSDRSGSDAPREAADLQPARPAAHAREGQDQRVQGRPGPVWASRRSSSSTRFPTVRLKGIVAEVTPISIPIRGSDVRIYYANVDITQGFDALRPGLSAEIMIEVETRHDVIRVPIDSIRWVGSQSYVALYDRCPRARTASNSWRWQEIEIGLSDPDLRGGAQGSQARRAGRHAPGDLPAPAPEKVPKADQVASRS